MSAGAAKVQEELARRAAVLLAVSQDWVRECMRWHGEVLTGLRAHWCADWDGLPVDETCEEWPCGCVFQPSRMELLLSAKRS